MVKRIAEASGIPEATVTVHDRNLADAGLRTKGGRGRSAAKMSATDVANLLVAVAGSSMVKDAVQTVEDYSALPSRSGSTSLRKDSQSFHHSGNSPPGWDLSSFPVPALQSLPANHSLRDALVALIEAAADGSLEAAADSLPVQEFGRSREEGSWKLRGFWGIEVSLSGPYPQAKIRIYCRDFSETHHYSAIPSDAAEIMKWAEAMDAKGGGGDLKQIREFSAKTIMAMGELLKS